MSKQVVIQTNLRIKKNTVRICKDSLTDNIVGQHKAKGNKSMVHCWCGNSSEMPQNSVLGCCWFMYLLLTWKWNNQLLADGITWLSMKCQQQRKDIINDYCGWITKRTFWEPTCKSCSWKWRDLVSFCLVCIFSRSGVLWFCIVCLRDLHSKLELWGHWSYQVPGVCCNGSKPRRKIFWVCWNLE